jgi:hypothetical protein
VKIVTVQVTPVAPGFARPGCGGNKESQQEAEYLRQLLNGLDCKAKS